MKYLKNVSTRVANLSLIGAVLVCSIHYREYILVSSQLWVWFPDSMLRIAVPFFFTVAGYWLAHHCDDRLWWWQAVCKRLRTLIIPFVALNLIWFCCTTQDWQFFAWRKAFGFVRGDYPSLPQTWFILRLFFFVLISPILIFVVRRSRQMGYALASIFYLGIIGRAFYCEKAFDSALLLPFRYIITPVGIAGFTLGLTFGKYGIPQFKQWCYWLCAFIGFVILYLSNRWLLSDGSGSVPGIFCFYFGLPLFVYGLWSCLPTTEPMPWLSRNTFAIYLFHYSYLLFFRWIMQVTNTLDWTSNFCVTILVVVLSVMLSALTAIAIKRLPLLHKIILGGR